MADDDWQGDVSVFAFDIAGFTNFDHAGQLETKELTERVLQRAAREADVKVEEQSWWADAGDGGYLLISGDSRQALRVLEKFVALMERENPRLVEHARVGLRYALNYGLVHRHGSGAGQRLVGDAINNCARLLSGITKDRIGQVVASGTYKDRVLAFGRVHAGLFTRLTDIVDKNGKVHEVWNVCQQPGFGIPPPTARG